ncbi:PorT family protein [Dyadobacter sp. CY107]|uniref:PorT family protein n=1 Tax=Dyadobacter fanqingshengii TaxID=2906443 RepID=A0A9X1T7A8_9BACT|nr:porin family protein [Dyadobacter fanqingshengii]MCF0038511.1 PorT family protein [Dyadobacter fanqingshengii]MCF2503961.1 PorT family protein [Dyadobacter fanqingshengii]USJ38755.1 PorT family protein [Dyadobacter fanqingshengii]
MAAQEVRSQGIGYRRRHLEFYDDKPIHYGILFGVPFTRFNVKHNNDFVSKDSAFVIQSPTNAAFRMGFIVNAFLTDHFDIRTTPSVSLYERHVKFSYPNGTDKIEKRESTWIEIPLLLKYKSLRRVNSRMYMVAGFTLGLETNVKRSRGGGQLDTKSSDFSIDYGVGYEQFFEFFKFAPELRFSHGLTNVFQPTKNSAGTGISKLSTHTVTLYLNFE